MIKIYKTAAKGTTMSMAQPLYEALLVEAVSIRTELELWIANPSGNNGVLNYYIIVGKAMLLFGLTEKFSGENGRPPTALASEYKRISDLLVSNNNPMAWACQSDPPPKRNLKEVMAWATRVSAIQVLNRSVCGV